MADSWQIEPDGDGNILDLPLSDEEEEARERCLAVLTPALIEIEEGRVYGFTMVMETIDGEHRLYRCTVRNFTGLSAQLMGAALEGLGMVRMSELDDYVRREEFE